MKKCKPIRNPRQAVLMLCVCAVLLVIAGCFASMLATYKWAAQIIFIVLLVICLQIVIRYTLTEMEYAVGMNTFTVTKSVGNKKTVVCSLELSTAIALIPVAEFTVAVELIRDDRGQVAGAVLQNLETEDYLVAKAKTVIIATGGAGRMHYQGFPTSNHYGATADGLILGYRMGAPLLYQDTIQYHPTGVAFPSQIFGALVTEKVRSVGAQLVNVDGEAFMHPLETRDVAASGIIRECTARGKGVNTPLGSGVWLDTPMIEMIGGPGTIEKRIPAMLRMYMKYDIDMRKLPILVYPTLHYQNGGLEIGGDGFTKVIDNLLVAGEAVGGIHGRNRLMGNSLLDIIVFGRNAGKAAAAKAKNVELGNMNLDHIQAYAEELKEAGIDTGDVSPLLLPKYARHER